MKLLAITLLLCAALATDHVFKLGADQRSMADADSDATPEDSAAAEDSAIKEVEAKIGDVLVFDLP